MTGSVVFYEILNRISHIHLHDLSFYHDPCRPYRLQDHQETRDSPVYACLQECSHVRAHAWKVV